MWTKFTDRIVVIIELSLLTGLLYTVKSALVD